jgi:hypothetical protein
VPVFSAGSCLFSFGNKKPGLGAGGRSVLYNFPDYQPGLFWYANGMLKADQTGSNII